MLRENFEEFVREREYVHNVAKTTIRWYHDGWNAWGKYLPERAEDIRPASIIARMREAGLSAVSVNGRVRVLNAWLRWMYNEKMIDRLIVASRMKEEDRGVKTFSEDQVRKILGAVPRSRRDARIILLVSVILDTGLRISEALALRKDDIDLKNLLIYIELGKGRKARIVPISYELRKRLYEGMKIGGIGRWLFETKNGTALAYRNARRDFALLCQRLGVDGVKLSFHPLRHTMASEYIRAGGDSFSLQRILGHSTLTMTRKYVHMNIKDLCEAHQRRSILVRES